MTRILAIARLTIAEGIRMRIVLVLLLLLGVVVLRLPFALRGDETLSGRMQTFLDYSLSAVSLLLSLATIFLSCSTLTSEFKTRTLHLVVTKPVSRFQILAGKWLGVMTLNVAILLVAGAAIYGFAVLVKQRPETNPRDGKLLREAIWTARVAAAPTEPDFVTPAREEIQYQQDKEGVKFAQGERAAIEERVRKYREEWLRIESGTDRVFLFENLPPPESAGAIYQVRFKVRCSPIPPDEKPELMFMFVNPENINEPLMPMPFVARQRHNEMHQFLVTAAGVVRDGRAVLVVAHTTMGDKPYFATFENREDLQILYRVGTFETNYVRTLLLLVMRLGFLSAIALFFSTFVSFPVACFVVISVYLFCLGVPWWLEVIGANMEIWDRKIDPYGNFGPALRAYLLNPLLKFVFPDFNRYDGVSNLINGTYIAPSLVAVSALHTLLYGTILLALPGWLIFRGREVDRVIVS